MAKSWNFSFYQSESLSHLFNRLLAHLECAALVLPDGKALHVLPRNPGDIATLPAAASQCHQYLSLKDGEIAISNDPYAGGTRLSEITLVMGASLETPDDTADVLIAVRYQVEPNLSFTGKIDDEGLRIPPMPLCSGNRINSEILTAMAGHPQAPRDLREKTEAMVQRLQSLRPILKRIARDNASDWRRANLRDYLQSCRDMFQMHLARLPLGETLVTTQLSSGETIKLRMDIKDEKVLFDFSGTDSSKLVQLTDLTVLGVCFNALCVAMNKPVPPNAGTLQLIEVHTPGSTLVSASAPAGTERGTTEGATILSNLILKALGRLSPSHKRGSSSNGLSLCELQFSDGRRLTDTIPGGLGASADHAGLDGFNPWIRQEHMPMTAEGIEEKYPVLVKSLAVRANSAGKGKLPGGHGLVKSLLLREPAKLSWTLEMAGSKPEGIEGGKAALGAEIAVIRLNGGEKEKLPPEGELQLEKGDIVRVSSPGGGGFGEPPAAT